MAPLLVDFPSGPLDRYRRKASFDWKKLKTFLDTEEIIEYQNELYEEIKKHPILFPQGLETPTLDEQRRIAALRVFALKKIRLLSIESQLDNLRKPMANLTTLFQLDPSVAIKHAIAFAMFPSVIQSLGTERHADYFTQSIMGEIVGAYCLTEIGHGSNAKNMQTTATYDKNTHEFVLHSPNFEAAKCWAGLLGQMATHAIVYAQLITPDGVNHALHPFIVQIRDTKTLKARPGVTVGDMGEKIGLNGIDNGFVMFNYYRIPKENLLNKTGDVSEDGTYITPFKDPNKRYGASLGALSMGRVTITGMCSTYAAHALTIAIRYAAIRKQFGPEDGEEVPILEYQSHQCRLIPHLAVAYALKIFASFLSVTQYEFTVQSYLGDKDKLADLGLELHAISSASKPISGWIVRDAVQECREACAGHGYLKAAGIGDVKNAHDANCTYEGENHVLIQQTSNWLLKFWPLILQNQRISSPLKSIDFLSNAKQILQNKLDINTIERFIEIENILQMFQWLVCYLLKISNEKCESLIKEGLDSFWAKNESQVFYCKSLGVAYIQHFMIDRIYSIISEAGDSQVKEVLMRLLSLFGMISLEKHIATFYQGGFASGPIFASLIQESILKLCKSLKDDAVALIDAIAPPDFLIKSVLGQSDGQVYKHLEEAMVKAPGALERPKWWKEILPQGKRAQSKL